MTKDGKLNVVLDLDSTIIFAADMDQKEKIPISFPLPYKDFVPSYRIFERPHLQDFLDYIFEHFNVAVFTAAERTYCLFIVDNFILIDRPNKPQRKLEFIFYDYHLDESHKEYGGFKDLRIAFDKFKVPNFYPCNTVIIDDNPDVFETNPLNCLPIEAYEIVTENNEFNDDAVNDRGLLKVLSKLKYIEGKLSTDHCLYGFVTKEHATKVPLLKRGDVLSK
jgi:hypothetical protein